MNCDNYEDQMSDYLEDALAPHERAAFDLHLRSCASCTEMLSGMTQVLHWAKSFSPPAPSSWLPDRIIANTPRVVRETWFDTLLGMGRWIIEPRTAMAVFTATLVLGWMGNLAGLSPQSALAFAQDPRVVYYEAEGAVNRVYDRAVRAYYQSSLVTEIHCRIEQLKDNS